MCMSLILAITAGNTSGMPQRAIIGREVLNTAIPLQKLFASVVSAAAVR